MELTMTHLVILTFFGFVITVSTIIFSKGEWKGTVKAAIARLTKEMETLTARVDRIYDLFLERGMRTTLESQSPLKLNELGNQIANELNLESLASIHVDAMAARTENLNVYEIQQACYKYVQKDLVTELTERYPDQFRDVSRMAYKHGIPREDVLQIIGILLRDKILQLRGYSQTDLDAQS